MARVTSISTLGWGHYTVYQALPKIAQRGFKRVEICSFATYCFHFNFGSPTPPELKKMLDDLDLTPIIMHFDAGNLNPWQPGDADTFLDVWVRKMDQLSELGIGTMSMWFGERNDRPDQEEQLVDTVKAYDRVAKAGEERGIKMLLEVPHVWTNMPRPEQVYWIFDHLESDNVGALVDCSHWGVIGYDIDEFLGRLGDKLWHIHLRDSRGIDTNDMRQELELTPGKGTVDFRKFGEALDAADYKGDVSLEFEYRDMTLDAIDHEFDLGLQHLVECGWSIPEGVRMVVS